MNPKSTRVWLIITAALFALVCLLQPILHQRPAGLKPLLPGLRPAAVTSMRIVYSGAPAICAARILGTWQLTKPIRYPAQTSAINALLNALQLLTPVLQLNASGSNQFSNAGPEYGFARPLTLDLQQGPDRWRLLVGSQTPPGDQV